MRYVLDTLEIERGRVARAIREFEGSAAQPEEEAAREMILRNRKRVLDEAIATLEEGAAVERELDPALDVDFPVEVLRTERARLLEVNRAMSATVESPGVKFPWGRIELNDERIAEIDQWIPVLSQRMELRSRIGFA